MKLNSIAAFIAYLITLPARIKGAKMGKNSFIGPGYDFLFSDFKGVTIGNNVVIGRNAWIQTVPGYSKNPKIIIGHGTQIGRNTVMTSNSNLIIGEKCLLAYHVSIFTQDHNLNDINKGPLENGFTKGKAVIIDDQCFIGAHSFILKGVHLGKHCIVGANSVVTKSFPPYSIIAGNPARLIKRLV